MRQILVVAFGMGLAACGSGGGSGAGGGGVSTVAFTSWRDVAPETEIVAPAISTEFSYSENLAERVTAVSEPVSYSGIEFRETFAKDGSVLRASVTTGDGTLLIFDTSDGARFTTVANGYATAAINRDESAVALVVEPLAQGWSYQTFGVWARDVDRTRRGRTGAVSTGNMTPASGVPQIGVGVFTGKATGLHLDQSGINTLFTAADMQMAVNFGTREANFQTRNTLASRDLVSWFDNPFLNIDGALIVVPGTNRLVGAAEVPGILAESTRMSGTIDGVFYGPNAQEVGGTFGLRGSGVETYIGGFGGRR